MLFSDIVGFTSICSTASPFIVISMLQELYNQFDIFCGLLDVYKVVMYIINHTMSNDELFYVTAMRNESNPTHPITRKKREHSFFFISGRNHRWCLLCGCWSSQGNWTPRRSNRLDGSPHDGSLGQTPDPRWQTYHGKLIRNFRIWLVNSDWTPKFNRILKLAHKQININHMNYDDIPIGK